MIDTYGRKYIQPTINVVAKGAVALHLTPINLTLIGLGTGIASAVTLGLGFPILAVIILWLSGLFDVLDGTVARKTKSSSDLGAFLDITFDRLVEVSLLLAFAFINPDLSLMLLLLAVTIILSLTIFLTVGNFAKNHSKKSFYYQAGIAERTEAFIFFTAMILLPDYTKIIGYIFAGIILFTAGQRFAEGIRILND